MIALLALIVLGPEKLPKLAAKLGHWTGRARVMARNLRSQLEQEVSYEELLQQKKEAEEALRKAQEAPMNFHADMQATAQSVQSDIGNIAKDISPVNSTPANEPNHDKPVSIHNSPADSQPTGAVTSNPTLSDAANTESPAKTDVTSQHAVPASSATS